MLKNELNPEITQIDFTDFDREFGDFLRRFTQDIHPQLKVTGMLAAFELRSGNPVLDLTRYAGKTFEAEPDDIVTLPPLNEWQELLLKTRIAALPQDDLRTPLVFTGENTLMLRRYAGYAANLRQKLAAMRRFNPELQIPEIFDSKLDKIQKLAVFTGLNSSLLILSGGPGTGKTTVCGHIIRELLEKNCNMRILFAAPTGKAQQNLAGQIRDIGKTLPESSPVFQALQRVKGATLHSFILNPQWRSELANCDLFITDECSMISLEMFSKLLDILPASTSLILAGDRRQLASIDSGSVFADICSYGKVNRLPEKMAEFFNDKTGIGIGTCENGEDFSGYIVELQKNFRSSQAPDICRIAELLLDGSVDNETLTDIIVNTDEADFKFRTIADNDLDTALRKRCGNLKKLPELCSSGHINQIMQPLQIIDQTKFICAVNRDERGTAAINDWILRELDIVPQFRGKWHPGTVLLVTANDRNSGLRNGDIGVVTLEKLHSEPERQYGVRFSSCPEKYFLLPDLPEHECGFAISVHRAQGSGYKEVTFLLPGYESKVLTRELLYTGITRAAASIEIWGSAPELLFALSNRAERSSNLFQTT